MYVYILRSLKDPTQNYVGLTSNLKRRFSEHNKGYSSHTRNYRPWTIQTALWFKDGVKAASFEKYLKSHSGLAFRSKHF